MRLRRGQLPIDARLDLHGMTQAEAHRALADFIAISHDAGRRCVLVITGKGGRAEDVSTTQRTGVLRQAVPQWLSGPPNAALVLATAPARPKDGGAGALYVLLRRRR
ncbi:MAG: Smr/MutS family protein [Alphaproteobacteria bacterium]|nr:Smr/MutS family protein [Alphaproteobacteria bacterium]